MPQMFILQASNKARIGLPAVPGASETGKMIKVFKDFGICGCLASYCIRRAVMKRHVLLNTNCRERTIWYRIDIMLVD